MSSVIGSARIGATTGGANTNTAGGVSKKAAGSASGRVPTEWDPLEITSVIVNDRKDNYFDYTFKSNKGSFNIVEGHEGEEIIFPSPFIWVQTCSKPMVENNTECSVYVTYILRDKGNVRVSGSHQPDTESALNCDNKRSFDDGTCFYNTHEAIGVIKQVIEALPANTGKIKKDTIVEDLNRAISDAGSLQRKIEGQY